MGITCMSASNCTVIHIGCVSTPMLHYGVLETQSRLGCMITASHNPVADSGIKVFDSHGRKSMPSYETLVSKTASSLAQEDREIDLEDRKAWMIPDSTHDVDHQQWLEQRVKFFKPLFKSELSSMNAFHLDSSKGHATRWLSEWLQQQGIAVEEVSLHAPAMNDGCGAGELSPGQSWSWSDIGSSGHLLIDSLSSQGRGKIVGAALDGDGDRVVLIDREGNILDGDDIMYILAYANPNRTGPWSGIVGTAMTNLGFEEGVKKLGYKFKRADVGDKYVSQMLQKEGWMLGGEPSGHIICRDLVSTGDGTIAALKVISSLLILEKNPEDILRNYTKMPQINVNVTVENKDIISDSNIQKKIKEIESDLTVGRVLVRPSGTESKIRIMIESDDEITAAKYAKDIATMFKK